VPLTLEHTFNQGLCNTLQQHLWRALDVTGENAAERLAELLAEDPAIGKRRAELDAMCQRLLAVQAQLNRFKS
jgi:hypothetical protein